MCVIEVRPVNRRQVPASCWPQHQQEVQSALSFVLTDNWDTVDYLLYGMSNSRYKKTKEILKHNSLRLKKTEGY
jgi:hypothetical protein